MISFLDGGFSSAVRVGVVSKRVPDFARPRPLRTLAFSGPCGPSKKQVVFAKLEEIEARLRQVVADAVQPVRQALLRLPTEAPSSP